MAVGEVASESHGVEMRRRVEAFDRLAGHVGGQIVVLGRREVDPSTLREALATIVQAMQSALRGFAPGLIVLLLPWIDADRMNPIGALDLLGQFF